MQLPGEPQQTPSRMNANDTARCQQAIELANSGQKQQAYQIFCDLYTSNPEDTTVLTWIAFTTPRLDEAQRAIATIERLEPGHPNLFMLHNRVSSMQSRGVYAQYPGQFGHVMTCPYCHSTGPAHITQKISIGGWICFAVLLIAFFPLCWVGLLMKKYYYACGRCSIALGDVAY